MAADDNETKASRARRVLEAAKADHARKEGRWLAVVPLGIGVLLLLLMMPRATAPDAVPLPRLDARRLAEVERADDARARSAEAERLPGFALAIGTALRALNTLDGPASAKTDELGHIDARRKLQGAMRDVPAGPEGEAGLLSLRAVQVRHFLAAVAHWEATGESNEDLVALSGSFVQRTEEAGWVEGGRHLLMNDSQRRVAFKVVWNVLVGVDAAPAFALSLDEERSLYAFYLEHPRTPEAQRLGLAAELESATTPEACIRAQTESKRQTEMWRADKIKRLGAIDPTYPTGYALGVAYYRAGRYDLSTESFNLFLGQHADGPYALRAKNHLKAALAGGAKF